MGGLSEIKPEKDKCPTWRALSSHLTQMLANTVPRDPRALAGDEEESSRLRSRLSQSTQAPFS